MGYPCLRTHLLPHTRMCTFRASPDEDKEAVHVIISFTDTHLESDENQWKSILAENGIVREGQQ